MNNSKKIILGFGALSLLVGLGTVGQALAYRGDPSVKGPNYTAERHAAMETAFEANDYASWKKLMEGKGRVTQVVTSANFSKMAEAHKLAENGDLAGAQKIRQELGLGRGMGHGRGMGMNRNNFTGR